MTEAVPPLEARGVGRRTPEGDRWLLENVSLSVGAGSRTAIVGPTGSGKTLLLRVLAQLDPVHAGEVLWRGQRVSGSALPSLRWQAMYLHQRPALVEGTVEDNLRLPFELKAHRGREFRRDGAIALLERVRKDEDFLSRKTSDLSGGEAQMVALLRGLQLRPAILLLDEPTAALDEESTRSVEELLSDWLNELPHERAWVWASHDRGQVARVAGRVLEMSGGRGTTREEAS